MVDKKRVEEDYQDDEDKEETLATPGVIDKYQAAGKIANRNFFLQAIYTHCSRLNISY